MTAEYTASFTVSAALTGCDESMMVERLATADDAALYLGKGDGRGCWRRSI